MLPKEPGRADTDSGQSAGIDAEGRAGYADFFARAAHDLRSPLGVILHVFRQLGTDLEPYLQEEHRTLLTLGGRGARRMQAFIDRLGLLAELESSGAKPVFHRSDFGELVKTAIDGVVATEPRTEVRIAFEASADPVFVNADKRLLTAALTELVRNAMVHSRKNARVTVAEEEGRASVSIEDDGSGITQEARRTLFQRFVVRKAHGGLGVGLSITRDIAELHGGTVSTADSTLPPARPGTVGAQFVLSLPTIDAPRAKGDAR